MSLSAPSRRPPGRPGARPQPTRCAALQDLRDVEELLDETVRRWDRIVGPMYARNLRRLQQARSAREGS